MRKPNLLRMQRGIHRILGLCLLAFLTLAAILYQKGFYDFTFIKRPDTTASQSGETLETEAAGEDTSPISKETDSVETTPVNPPETSVETSVVDNQNADRTTQDEEKTVTPASIIAGLSVESAAKSKGYTTMTAGEYDAARCILARVNLGTLSKKFSFSTYQRRTTTTTEYERGCLYTEETYITDTRPAVTLKNGFILVDVNGELTLYQADGTRVRVDYDEDKFYLTELRDENGNALFCSVSYEKQTIHAPIMVPDEFTGRLVESGEYEEEETEITAEVHTYYILLANGQFQRSDYTDEYPTQDSDRGLTFDAPQDYGESDCDLERYYSYGRWGYRSKSTGQTVVYPRFTKAYNFNDGYAVAFDGYSMYFLDESGTITYSVGYDEPEVFATFNEITLPDTNGIEALGTYYFSHGLTRVRERKNLVTYQVYYYIKESDETVLYDQYGNLFDIPSGYTLQSYSDGVLLLKKNDEELYGYMNYKGEWIAQPIYTYARPFLSGLGVLGDKDGDKGIIDTKGNWVLPAVYDYVSDISSGMVAVYDQSIGWNVLKIMKK